MQKYIKSGFLGFAILLGCLIPPPIHWVTGPLGPFIGGFVGGFKARADLKGGIIIGLIMGTCLTLLLSGIFFALLSFQPSATGKINEMLNSGDLPVTPVLMGVFIGITAFGTLSARIGGKVAEKAGEEGKQP